VRRQPHSIEAEQAVLGSALCNNAVLDRCPWLEPTDFFEPVHARIWAAMREARAKGELADALVLKRLFDADAALAELDGAGYLKRMAYAAETLFDAREHARLIKDLAKRRELIAIAEDLRERAFDPAEPEDPGGIVASCRPRLEALCLDETRPPAGHVSQVIDGLVREIEHPRPVWRTGVPALDTSLGGACPRATCSGSRPA
jgi:replicative DNA helicase